MHIVEDLDGTNMVRAKVDDGEVLLTLVSASGFSETGYFPAESLTISSLEGVIALRDVCDRLISACTD